MKQTILSLLCFAVYSAYAQTDSLCVRIQAYEDTLSNEIMKKGKPYPENTDKKKQQYKQYDSYSGAKYLVFYESKQPKKMYCLTPNGYFYFDTNLDGIFDGKYLDKTSLSSKDIWKNVLFISGTPKHAIDSTFSQYVEVAKIEDSKRFYFSCLRDSVPTVYNLLRNEGTPEVIPVPFEYREKFRTNVQQEILKILTYK